MQEMGKQQVTGKYQASRYVYDFDSAKQYLNACIRESKSSIGDERKASSIEQENILEFAKAYHPAKVSFFEHFFDSL